MTLRGGVSAASAGFSVFSGLGEDRAVRLFKSVSESAQVVWLGNPSQPRELIEIAVKTGNEGYQSRFGSYSASLSARASPPTSTRPVRLSNLSADTSRVG
jgi:hypothetical protein